jgi:hypothetical protein
MRAIAKALMISACVLALAACGGDDGDGGAAGTASGGTGGGDSGSGGTGGGDSGSGGTGGGGTGGMASPVMCGGMTCPAPTVTAFAACCVDDGDVCGQEIRGGLFGQCAPPTVPDDECENISVRGVEIIGCCTPEGRCGIGAGMFLGEPCTSIEDVQELAQTDGGDDMGGMFGELPMPKACTP